MNVLLWIIIKTSGTIFKDVRHILDKKKNFIMTTKIRGPGRWIPTAQKWST